MSVTKTKRQTAQAAKRSRQSSKASGAASNSEVLTLPEAAAFLRCSEETILCLVRCEELPGREIEDGWRFLKSALQSWLATAPTKKGLLSQLGAIKGDPYAEEMLKEIYKSRGRPETEEG
jgi:hypothetical protein